MSIQYDGDISKRARVEPADLPAALENAEELIKKRDALIPRDVYELEYKALKDALFYGVKATLYPVTMGESTCLS